MQGVVVQGGERYGFASGVNFLPQPLHFWIGLRPAEVFLYPLAMVS